MSTVSIVILVIVSLFILLMIVPRILTSVASVKLNGKAAPTLHAASASRIKSDKKTVLYFYTPPCGACKMQEPIIERVKKYAPETVFKIDASCNQDAALAYGVMGVLFSCVC